jgi:hypothetical protein
MRLIFMAHCIQILSSQEFLYDNSKHENDDYQKLITKIDDVELQTIQKLVEKITKNHT